MFACASSVAISCGGDDADDGEPSSPAGQSGTGGQRPHDDGGSGGERAGGSGGELGETGGDAGAGATEADAGAAGNDPGGAAGTSAGGAGTAGAGPRAEFVDTGYFLRATSESNGATVQSFHWESPDGEHQSYFAGNQNIASSGINIERRPYFAFDVGDPDGSITAATLRLWVWQPANANNNTGAFASDDASETFELWSVESFSASEVIDAPFNQTTDHDLDVRIWEDLGDGTRLGSRVYSEADETTHLIPSPTTAPDTACGLPTSACGKWVEIELNDAALQDLNVARGLWVIGAKISTIGPNPGAREWVNNGALVDLSSRKGVFPDFSTPPPELVLRGTADAGSGGAGGQAGNGSGAAGSGGASAGSGAGGGGTSGNAGSGGTGGSGGTPVAPNEIVLQHVHRGSFNSAEAVDLFAQPWKVVGNSYQVRSIGDGTTSIPASRDYFTFDLSSIEASITGARLRIFHPGNSYDSPDASETVTLFDVTTPSSVLQAPDESQGPDLLTAIFNDLGSGTSFGSFLSSLTDNGTTESIELNAAGVASLNSAAAANALWSIGGSLTSANVTDANVFERVFRGSDGSGGSERPATELVLTF